MSLFHEMPFPLVAIILAVIGALIGSFINLGVYQLGYFLRRPVSPWSTLPDSYKSKLGKRSWLDLIPVFGWLRLRRESSEFGKLHWLRPMAIEIFAAAGLVAMFWWYNQGGLGTNTEEISSPEDGLLRSWNSLWFIFHATLFILLAIATFIDFDERTIPDWITIPGTLFALLVTAFASQVRLPIQKANLVDQSVLPLNFNSPYGIPEWHHSSTGLMVGILIIGFWCFGLLPKLVTLRFGLVKGIKFFLATLIPMPRKNQSPQRSHNRGFNVFHFAVLAVFVVSCVWSWFVWQRGGDNWDSLFGSLLGMAMGGGLTWAVRIIAGLALRVEAMGFGDVTLMAMIGAFVGWQPALLIFAIAPFTSILIALSQKLTTGDPKIAFGPYLCLATVIVVIGWRPIWNEWASQGIFSMGAPILLAIIGGALAMMGLMLLGLGLSRRRYEE